MASINEAVRFILGNTMSDEMGLMIAYFSSSDSSSNDEQFNIITSTTPYIDTWHSHGKVKVEPLKFSITVIKQEGGYFDTYEERATKKMLVKNERNWLQVDQDDHADIMYYCYMVFNRKENVGQGTAGLVFDVICDAPWAWSGLRKKIYTAVSNTLSFNLNSIVDFDSYIIYPTLIFTCLGATNISIKNNTTNETVVINNCSLNEVVTLECSSDKIKSSTGRNLMSDWNKVTLGIAENTNSFTLTGNFKVEFQYRLPIRIGG